MTTLTKTEEVLVDAVLGYQHQQVPVYEVATWRGRFVLVADTGGGMVARRGQWNMSTLHRLLDLGRLSLGEYERLGDVSGLPTSGGRSQRSLPRRQSGRRVTVAGAR